MPTYDYECSACGHKFEELQSFSDAPLTKCPKCKKNKLARLFGGGGAIIFKGGGFYETDYRRAGEKADKAETEAPKTETKSEPTPAPAADSTPKSAAKSDGKGGAKKDK